MPAAVMPLLVMLLIAVAGAAIWFGWKAEQQRREALAALARRRGWRFDPDKNAGHDEFYGHFEIFARGHSRAAYNTLVGDVELFGHRVPMQTGDYLYKVTTSNGKSTTTHTYRFSYLIVHLPFPELPSLRIRREHLFDKLAGAFGFDDIDFESEEFSRRYHVKSTDKRFAYDVLHPRMMEFVMAVEPEALDIEHERCCLSDGRTRWKPEDFEDRLELLTRFFDHWPEHVTTERLP